MCIYTSLCIRLPLIKLCLCFFLDVHLYSNGSSTIATISSVIMSEMFPACYFCSNSFKLLHIMLGLDDKITVFEIPEVMIAGDLKNLIKDLSRSLLRPFCLISNFIYFPNSKTNFQSCCLEW